MITASSASCSPSATAANSIAAWGPIRALGRLEKQHWLLWYIGLTLCRVRSILRPMHTILLGRTGGARLSLAARDDLARIELPVSPAGYPQACTGHPSPAIRWAVRCRVRGDQGHYCCPQSELLPGVGVLVPAPRELVVLSFAGRGGRGRQRGGSRRGSLSSSSSVCTLSSLSTLSSDSSASSSAGGWC